MALWLDGNNIAYKKQDYSNKVSNFETVAFPEGAKVYALSAIDGEPCFLDKNTGRVFVLDKQNQWIEKYAIPLGVENVQPQGMVKFYASMIGCNGDVYLSYLAGPQVEGGQNQAALVRLSDGKVLKNTAVTLLDAKCQEDGKIQLYAEEMNGVIASNLPHEYHQFTIKGNAVEERTFTTSDENENNVGWRLTDANGNVWQWLDADLRCVGANNFMLSKAYAGFKDVKETQWYGSKKEGIVKMTVQLGIMDGYPDGAFHPNDNIRLSEAAKMAAVVHATYHGKLDALKTETGKKWYDKYVSYCIENGILKQDEFQNVEAYATRGELAHIFAKTLPNYDGIRDVTFADISDVHTQSAYADDILLLYRAGILSGYPDGSFKANELVSRVEATSIISRVALPTMRIG